MDLLSKADRDKLRAALMTMFEPMGTTDQFIVVGFGVENRAFVVHFRSNGTEVNAIELLRSVAEGEPISYLDL
jgi:hypothetical protein